MLINELTFYELKRIITPVIQLQPMSLLCSEIGEVLGIPKANRDKITEQDKFSLRYNRSGATPNPVRVKQIGHDPSDVVPLASSNG